MLMAVVGETSRSPETFKNGLLFELPEFQKMTDLMRGQAKKRGVTRQALIKMWLADRLEAAG